MMYSNYYFAAPKSCIPVKNYRNDSKEKTFRPKMNVSETENEIRLEFALPGILKSDIKIQIEEGILNLEAQRKSREDNQNFRHREFGNVTFKTRLRLPENIDQQNINANFENGMLTVVLNKIQKQIHQIEIK